MDIWKTAVELYTADKYQEADPYFDVLLANHPLEPGLLATYGTMCSLMKKNGLAIALLEASMKLKGKRDTDVLTNLSLAYKNFGMQEKAFDCMEQAIKIDPNARVLTSHAGYLLESSRQDEAIANCKKAIKLEPDFAMAHWNLALMLLSQGQWDSGWDEHEYGFKAGMRVDRGEVWGIPVWDGSPGKKVVIYGEQGIGDEIMFASMIPDVLKTNEVIIECHERLVTTFQKAFPGVSVYGTREDPEPKWPAKETADARISIGSLGKFYRRSREAFPGTPYLNADPIPKGEKFRVGISWSGGYKKSRREKRTVPLSYWQTILGVPNVEFVSLQYTDCKEELDVVGALGYEIKVMDDLVKAEDYYETAKVVKSCDLVISVCTSVIHLAGALGVPCWVMTPKHPAWRYQNQGGMPWYRSVRLYRQMAEKEWMPVVQRVGLDLDELVNGRRELVA